MVALTSATEGDLVISTRVCDDIQQALMTKLSALIAPYIPPTDAFMVEAGKEDGNIVIKLNPGEHDDAKIRQAIAQFCKELRVKNDCPTLSEKLEFQTAGVTAIGWLAHVLAGAPKPPARTSSFRNKISSGEYSLLANSWEDMVRALNEVLPHKVDEALLGRGI